ncbi:MAG: response regulator [Anaerolineae bacterium]
MASKPRVLIMAPDESIRKLMQDVLVERYDTAVAGDVLEGTDFLLAERFDLLVLEDNMPVIMGREFLEFLKAHDEFQSLPVVIVSEALDLEQKIRSKRNCSFLSKPFGLDQLVRQIQGLLEPHPQQPWAANASNIQAAA